MSSHSTDTVMRNVADGVTCVPVLSFLFLGIIKHSKLPVTGKVHIVTIHRFAATGCIISSFFVTYENHFLQEYTYIPFQDVCDIARKQTSLTRQTHVTYIRYCNNISYNIWRVRVIVRGKIYYVSYYK
jgi:hypothetical protein